MMQGALIEISGNWAHFKKPETNNNPLTHDFITKTALIGLIGAVLGIERQEMKELFPRLSEDLLYGVTMINPLKKQSFGFTSRSANSPTSFDPKKMKPKAFEFLCNPSFLVALALKNIRSEKIFVEFINYVSSNQAFYTPVLGLHNCPANLKLNNKGNFSDKKYGSFSTKSFVSQDFKIDVFGSQKDNYFRIGFENIPTFQNNDFWNLPEYYKKVVYPLPSQKSNILVVKEGEFFELDGESWWLV